jgi:hypothetical protein
MRRGKGSDVPRWVAARDADVAMSMRMLKVRCRGHCPPESAHGRPLERGIRPPVLRVATGARKGTRKIAR